MAAIAVVLGFLAYTARSKVRRVRKGFGTCAYCAEAPVYCAGTAWYVDWDCPSRVADNSLNGLA